MRVSRILLAFAAAAVGLSSLTACAGTASLTAGDLGLSLDTASGLVQSTALSGYVFAAGIRKHGFFITDFAAGTAPQPAEGTLSYDGAGHLTGTLSTASSQVQIIPSLKAVGSYISCRARVLDTSSPHRDRALVVSFRIPLHAGSGLWQWDDDLRASRTIFLEGLGATLAINGNDAEGENCRLLAGEVYDITASGFPLVSQVVGQTSGWWADAEFAEYWSAPGYPGGNLLYRMEKPYNDSTLWDVLIDGSPVDWLGSPDGQTWAPHTYSPDHTYKYSITGTGTLVNFSRLDALRDNRSGNLTLDIVPANPELSEGYPYETTQLYGWDPPYSLNRYISKYPFSSMRSDNAAISMAIPLSEPRIYKFSYVPLRNGEGYLEVSFEIGLSPDLTKSPNEATVEFIIYANDPAWGLRSAARNYYDIYPETFHKYASREGIWLLGLDCGAVSEPWDFGFMFDEAATASDAELIYDDIFDIYGLNYIELGGVWAAFTGYDDTPNAAFPWEAGVGYEELETQFLSWRYQNPAFYDAVEASALCDKNGNWIWSHWTDQFFWAAKASHLKASLDPDIPGGYGSWLMNAVTSTLESLDAGDGKTGGVFLDSLSASISVQWEDYRRAHWAYSDAGLTFSHDTKTPVSLLGDGEWKFVRDLSAFLRARDKLILANVYPVGDKFFHPFLDAFGIETFGGTCGGSFWPYLRVMANQKPVSWLDYFMLSDDTAPEWFSRERAMNNCLAWGMYPGTADFIYNNAANIEEARPVYKEWMPRILEVGSAGWQPITLAQSPTANVWVERFGDFATNGVVYFTVYSNWDFTGSQGEISIDRQGLGIPAGATLITEELTTGDTVNWTQEDGGARMKTQVSLPGIMRTRAIRIATPQGLSGVWAARGGEFLRRVHSQMKWLIYQGAPRDLKSAIDSLLPQVKALVEQCDDALAANNSRPPEATLISLRNSAAEMVVLIGQLRQDNESSVICLQQCQVALEAFQKAMDLLHFLPTTPTGSLSGHVELDYSLLWREAQIEIIPAAQEMSMGIVLGSPLQQGALAKRYDQEIDSGALWMSKPRREQYKMLYQLLDETGIPLPEMALRFTLSNPAISCVLNGAKSLEEVEQNVAAAEKGPLPDDLLGRLAEIYQMVPFRPYEEPFGLPFAWPYAGPGGAGR